MIELQKFILILLMTLIIIYIYQLISKDNIKDNFKMDLKNPIFFETPRLRKFYESNFN